MERARQMPPACHRVTTSSVSCGWTVCLMLRHHVLVNLEATSSIDNYGINTSALPRSTPGTSLLDQHRFHFKHWHFNLLTSVTSWSIAAGR